MWGWHSREDKAEGTVVPQNAEVTEDSLTDRKQNHGHLSYLRLENSKEFSPIGKISYWGFEKGGESVLVICFVCGSLFWYLLHWFFILGFAF